MILRAIQMARPYAATPGPGSSKFADGTRKVWVRAKPVSCVAVAIQGPNTEAYAGPCRNLRLGFLGPSSLSGNV